LAGVEGIVRKAKDHEECQDWRLDDKRWRLNNLYRVMDDQGRLVPFRLNWAQEILHREKHTLNIILKARQLGCTTYINIDYLDDCLFESYLTAGIVAHNEKDAGRFFRDKVLLPYRHLPENIKITHPAIKESAQGLGFSNFSSVHVGTSLRSGTVQRLHISEYGIVCARYPEKAREIKTGALNTVAQGQVIWIESTAKGRGGHFHELCQQAMALLALIKAGQKKLGPMDWKFFFFPWWEHDKYETEPEYVTIGPDDEEYFQELADKHGIQLSDRKKAWYVKKKETQGEDMKQEFPSHPDEAFEASVEGSYFGALVSKARREGRVAKVPPYPAELTHTFWDLGIDDPMAIWFVQFAGLGIHLVDYYEFAGEGMAYYVRMLKERAEKQGYLYGEHWAPHDIEVREIGPGISRKDTAASLGIRFEVVPQTPLVEQREAVRNIFHRCYFDQARCKTGIERLENYRKEWSEKLGCFIDRPVHDMASHGASAFMTMACACKLGAGSRVSGGMSEQDVAELQARYGRRV